MAIITRWEQKKLKSSKKKNSKLKIVFLYDLVFNKTKFEENEND